MNEYIIMPSGDYQSICDNIRIVSGKTDLIKSGDLSTEIAELTNKIGKAEFKVYNLPSTACVDQRSVAYGGDKFVAVGKSDVAIYSEDGINWTEIALDGAYGEIVYGGDKFAAIGLSNDVIYSYSTDGINWSDTYTLGFFYRGSIAYGNGRFVMTGSRASSSDNYNAAYSDDGINWTTCSLPSTSRLYKATAYGNGKFVTMGNNTKYAAYSIDGVNWTQVTLPISGYWTKTVYGDDKFVTVGYYISGSYTYPAVIYSTDGVNWTKVTMPNDLNKSGTQLWSITYGADKFVITGSIMTNKTTHMAAYSTDGINWIKATMPSNTSQAIAYNDGKFVAVGKDSVVACCDTIAVEIG